PAAIDSLTEVVAAFQSADGDINNAITNLANAATVDLSAEVSRAISAEESLSNAKLSLTGGIMSGILDMGDNSIDSVTTISANEIVPNNIWNPYGVINLQANLDAESSATIINLPAPTNGGDATNKTYVD
ncbi:MAG: hypothetical protein ACK55Z_22515, partial [bacterium]